MNSYEFIMACARALAGLALITGGICVPEALPSKTTTLPLDDGLALAGN